jgi:hypothetical protein
VSGPPQGGPGQGRPEALTLALTADLAHDEAPEILRPDGAVVGLVVLALLDVGVVIQHALEARLDAVIDGAFLASTAGDTPQQDRLTLLLG